MTHEKTDVLLIGGMGRSGSTLLLRVLGSLDGYFAIGELCHLWREIIPKNGLCGCGKRLQECEFWQAVMDEAFGGFDRIDLKHMQSLYQLTQKSKSYLQVVYPRFRTDVFERQQSEYAAGLESIYQAIQKISGCDVIVDSSKVPRYAFTLAEMPSIRPTMIHLVRDSRAVAHSWTRKLRRPDIVDNEEFMPQFNAVETARRWNSRQFLTTVASRRFAASVVYRYEDFAADPKQSLQDILVSLGITDLALTPFVSDDEVQLGNDHCLWGNPNRFDHGVITIRPDSAWRNAMPPMARLQVTLVTLPGLIWYGYVPSRTHSTSEDSGIQGTRPGLRRRRQAV